MAMTISPLVDACITGELRSHTRAATTRNSGICSSSGRNNRQCTKQTEIDRIITDHREEFRVWLPRNCRSHRNCMRLTKGITHTQSGQTGRERWGKTVPLITGAEKQITRRLGSPSCDKTRNNSGKRTFPLFRDNSDERNLRCKQAQKKSGLKADP
jgi:hypothetical protein